MEQGLAIDGESLSIEDFVAVSHTPPGAVTLTLAPTAQERVLRARRVIEQFVARGEVIYGVATGFGAFKDRIIPVDQVGQQYSYAG